MGVLVLKFAIHQRGKNTSIVATKLAGSSVLIISAKIYSRPPPN